MKIASFPYVFIYQTNTYLGRNKGFRHYWAAQARNEADKQCWSISADTREGVMSYVERYLDSTREAA